MTDEQLRYTIGEMYRIAHDYRFDVAPYSLSDPQAVFDFVKNLPYRRDVDFCGSQECLQRPKYTIGGGDCDDKSVFAGAAFDLLSIPWRFVTSSFRPDGEQEHIYLEIYVDGEWKPFDATYPRNTIYTERTNTKKIIWDNPMLKQGSYGVRTLEGSPIDRPLGFAPLLLLADLDSLFASLNTALQNLPLIGSLFKGKTQHVDYQTALTTSQNIGNKCVAIYNALPDDKAKAYAMNLAQSFFQNWIMPDLGHRWDNAIANDYARVIAGTYENLSQWWKDSDAFRFQYYLAQCVFYFVYLEDATRVQDSLTAWYTDPVKSRVWDPLDSYLNQNYGETTSGGSGTITPTTAGLGSGSMIGILAIGGAIIAAMAGGKKRR
jgi:hypothetical protein